MPPAQPSLLASNLDQPFGDDELDALADDLESTGNDFDWTTGFLTAVVSGPELVAPSTWMPVVFGEDAFADVDDAQRKIGRVTQFYNEIASVLAGDGETICPPSSDHDRIESFCRGYLTGAGLHGRWVSDPTAVSLLTPMGILAGDLDVVELRDEDGRPVEGGDELIPELREELDLHVRSAYRHWAGARGRTATGLSAPKVGRNDPCPCGSGKKYKKCCW